MLEFIFDFKREVNIWKKCSECDAGPNAALSYCDPDFSLNWHTSPELVLITPGLIISQDSNLKLTFCIKVSSLNLKVWGPQ